MSGIRPGEFRCVVMLGFDVDGVTGAIIRRPESAQLPSLMSMREYGPSVGVPRIIDMLGEYGIKASFFIPGYVAETHETLVLQIKARGHEIAHHGYMHEPPATLSMQQEEEVLDRGTTIIERITGDRMSVYPVRYVRTRDRRLLGLYLAPQASHAWVSLSHPSQGAGSSWSASRPIRTERPRRPLARRWARTHSAWRGRPVPARCRAGC